MCNGSTYQGRWNPLLPTHPPPESGFELENHHAATSNPETATHAGRLALVVTVFVPRRVLRSVVVSVPKIGARRASETCATTDLDSSAAYLIPASARGTAAMAAAIRLTPGPSG